MISHSDLRVDEEFRDLIPALSPEDKDALKKSILEDGYNEFDPIIAWDGTIVDGHNRYEICNGSNPDGEVIEFTVVERSFGSREAAKEWIIRRQLSRRNLPERARIRLNKRLREVVGERRGGDHKSENAKDQTVQLNGLVGETRDEIARRAQTSATKVTKDDAIERTGDPNLDRGLDDGTFSWDNAYHLALVKERCGSVTYEALWEAEDRIDKDTGRAENVRYSTAQLKHLLTMPDDETAADLVEIVESGQPIEDPKTGKMRVITSVQDAHKFRQEERKKAKREADRAVALELVRDSDQCTLTDEQDVIQCDALITDPPYGILASQGVGWDSFKDFEEFSREWLSRWNECGADFMASFWSQRYLFEGRRWFDEELTNYEFTQILTWVYRNNKSPQSRTMFKQTWEPVFFYRRKDSDKQIRIEGGSWGEDLHDLDTHIAAVPQSNFNEVDTKEHPAQKPLSVMRWLVGATTRAGDLVVDPFCGSGTTGIAALQLERRFAGLELDPEYRTLAEGRLAQYGVA